MNLIDGYWSSSHQDGYVKEQLNVKLSEQDMEQIREINREFFENEASNSMLGRILIRKGIKFYQERSIYPTMPDNK